jgi:hypothetical protein
VTHEMYYSLTLKRMPYTTPLMYDSLTERTQPYDAVRMAGVASQPYRTVGTVCFALRVHKLPTGTWSAMGCVRAVESCLLRKAIAAARPVRRKYAKTVPSAMHARNAKASVPIVGIIRRCLIANSASPV